MNKELQTVTLMCCLKITNVWQEFFKHITKNIFNCQTSCCTLNNVNVAQRLIMATNLEWLGFYAEWHGY
jgi:hypothetical protein